MFTKLSKYGELNTHDLLKFLAVLIMVVDHMGFYLFPDNITLRAVGRACIPIWFYFIGRYHSDKPAHDLWVYAFAVVLLKIIYTGTTIFAFNILFSFILIRWLLGFAHKYEWHKHGIIPIFLLITIFTPATLPIIAYGSIGFAFAYCGYLQRIGYDEGKTNYFFFLSLVLYMLMEMWSLKPDLVDTIIMVTLTALTTALVNRYSNREYKSFAATPIKLIARYSLQFYFIHIAIFMIISIVIR